MKSKSRQGRIEARNRKRNMHRTLDLAAYPGFDWEPGHYIYNHMGMEVRLRFSQKTFKWTAKAPYLKIETTFLHMPPQDIQWLLDKWLLDHEAQLRQTWPVVSV